MSKLIYVADDEQNIRDVVKSFLENDGYIVVAFASGDELLAAFRQKPSDLVILDIMMPGTDGFAVCVQLRQFTKVPIIMLTARDSDFDYITGINLGSDDYFTKPFSSVSLVMRVKAIFRRIEFDRSNQTVRSLGLSFGDISIQPSSKGAMMGSEPLELTPNEYNLLVYLMEHQERAVSRDELLEKVWGYECVVETRAVDDTVRRLRRKIANSKVVIDTVWGFGFRLKVRENDEDKAR